MNKLLTYFYCASLLCCTELNAMENSSLPNVLLQQISLFVSKDDNKNLRMVSKCAKKKVDDLYTEKLKIQFGNNTNADLEDLLTDRQEPFPAPFESHYTNKIMTEVCTDYLKKDGYLFVSQGSLLEGHLSGHYKSVPLYDYLKNKEEETKELYKAFFGKDLPEGKEILGLKLLTACLPSNHIYVDKDTKKTDYSELIGKFQERLLQSIRVNKIKYFLCGIDEPSTLSDEDVIVINQSDVDLGFISHLDNSSVSRTIIYNADQEELSFFYPPNNMKNIILVNGDNRCVKIDDEFLQFHENLQSCGLKGLTNIQRIGNGFLSRCYNLVIFDSKGMTSVQTIGNWFLSVCEKLDTFDSKGLTSVQTIGNGFLSRCDNLATFDSKDMKNVQTIGDFFLFFCKKLTTFYSKGMTNVQTIGGRFLSSCRKLTTFDTNGLMNVHTIGRNFLSHCENLDTFDTEGLTSVQTIGNYFLSDCENLVTFDSKGLTSVQKIGNNFLSGCKNLDTFDRKVLTSVQKIGLNFLG